MTDVTYTAIATTTGEGRSGGRTTSNDGILDLPLAIPKELGGNGGATNPEQLFAAGWSACFIGATKRAAAARKLKVRDLAVIVEITLHHEADDFWLSAVLHLEVSGIDQQSAEELGKAAHQICPYSRATRGNIEVTIDATVA